jgi:hypothetical protein
MIKQRQLYALIIAVILAGCEASNNSFYGYGDAANNYINTGVDSAAGYNGAMAGSTGIAPVDGSAAYPDSAVALVDAGNTDAPPTSFDSGLADSEILQIFDSGSSVADGNSGAGTGGAGTGGAGTGGAGTGGAGTGGAGTGGNSTLDTCSPPPADAPPITVDALNLVNEIRLAMGSGCMNLVMELNASAQAHCDYGTANRSNPSCSPDAHTEVSGCTGFTGTTVQAREIAAGYPRTLAYTEVAIAIGNNPAAAVPSWINTPFHRIPLLDPWTVDMGYGGAAGCDVIDIGRGTSPAPPDAITVYPYDGQIDVPPSWNGLEAPAPPAPAGGWPSSYPISVYAQAISVTEHVMTKEGDNIELEHVWLDRQSPLVSAGLKGYFTTTALMYGAPFEANTTYRVKVVGTHTGGAFNIEWTFTTGASRPGWW